MKEHSKDRSFWTPSSAYQEDWFAAPVAARSGLFKRLRDVFHVFVVLPLRTHRAAAAEARRHRVNLDEM